MLSRVAATVARHAMLPEGSRVVAAVSGGVDSLALVYALRELKFEISGIAHVNHGLRGEESEGDQQFVAAVARSLHVSLYCVSPPSNPTGNLEQNLRRSRREFFVSLIRQGAATHVALGHTRDDQAETVLFRLLRGSGITGLAGILPVTADGIVRPLLDVTRAEIEEFLSQRQLMGREDSSNSSRRFARNRIRHDLLPQLRRDWNPQLTAHLADLASLAYEEERWWASEICRLAPGFLTPSGEGVDLDVEGFRKLPDALQRRLVRHAIREACKGKPAGTGATGSFEHVERIRELAGGPSGEGRLQLPGLDVIRSFEWVRFTCGEAKMAVPVGVPVPGSSAWIEGRICLELDGDAADACDSLKVELLPAQLELRGWRPGDQYYPLRLGRKRKLRDMFQDARIPSWRRFTWPILTNGKQILWAKGFGVAAEFAAEPGAGRFIRVREEVITSG